MPSAFVSLVLVVLCAAAYMHFTQPSSPPPPASAQSAEARRVQSIIEKESGGEAVRAPPPSASAKSAEARRVQSIIEKESGGEAVRALFLVSASGEPKKSQHNTLKNRLQIAAKLAFY